jgi:hypothetical protein
MEIRRRGRTIAIEGKILNSLDKQVVSFTKMLGFRYAIVSGYVALLFGRTRATEDIDVLIESLDRKAFSAFYEKLAGNRYYIINADNENDAFAFLNEGIPLRIARVGTIIPNFEVKTPKDEIGRLTLDKRMSVKMGKYKVAISPIGLQIAFKLYLGSEKDYLDARHLFGLLKEDINMRELRRFIRLLRVKESIAKKILGV